MKKIFIAMTLVLAFAAITGCKEKRCACTTTRGDGGANGEYVCHSLEPKGSHKDCSELNKEWTSSDSTNTMLLMECVEEED